MQTDTQYREEHWMTNDELTLVYTQGNPKEIKQLKTRACTMIQMIHEGHLYHNTGATRSQESPTVSEYPGKCINLQYETNYLQ